MPNGTIGYRWAEAEKGHWNLEMADKVKGRKSVRIRSQESIHRYLTTGKHMSLYWSVLTVFLLLAITGVAIIFSGNMSTDLVGLLNALDIRAAHVVGASMGGMSALAFCTLYPKAADGLVTISSAARAEPFAIAMRSLQREIIRSDPRWNGGDYEPEDPPIRGMQLARKLGMISYRSAEEWAMRFGRERTGAEHDPGDSFGIDFEVESYLEAHASKFTGGFDPNCYLYLSRAMDLFDVGEHSGCVATELGRSTVSRALVVGAESDFLFPIHQQEDLAECLEHPDREVDFVSLPSIQGHDSFLVDMDRFRPVISAFYDRS